MNLPANSPIVDRPHRALRLNTHAAGVAVPPIPQAQRWLARYDGAFGVGLDMSQAVPGHAPPADFAHAFEALANDAAAARYGPILGDDDLRKAYAAEQTRVYGTEMRPADVAITAGCNQAFFVSALALAAAGDTILLPTPWYFNHQMTLDMLGITARPLPTRAEDGFVPTPEALDAAIDATTRALVLVSPNNPTGAVYPPERIEALFEICKARGIALVLDETYRDFLDPTNSAPHRLFERSDWSDTLIGLYSFSKSFAIPGHRLGALTAGPSVLATVETILDCVQICAARPSQIALARSMAKTLEWRAERTAEIAARNAAFRAAMSPLADWPIAQIGAYFAYVRHPYPERDALAVAKALAVRHGLLVLPGSFFGPDQERYLRVAFANVDEARIRQFAARLARVGDLFEPDQTRRTDHG